VTQANKASVKRILDSLESVGQYVHPLPEGTTNHDRQLIRLHIRNTARRYGFQVTTKTTKVDIVVDVVR